MNDALAASPQDTAPTTLVRAACPHDCPDTCAMHVTVQAGRVIRIQGDPDHPPTHGALCTKVSRYAERSYHPERVLHPLKRVGPKAGPPRFERIGWDEALGTIAARLKAIAGRGPGAAQAILPYSYAGTMGLVQGDGMGARFHHRLGASPGGSSHASNLVGLCRVCTRRRRRRSRRAACGPTSPTTRR